MLVGAPFTAITPKKDFPLVLPVQLDSIEHPTNNSAAKKSKTALLTKVFRLRSLVQNSISSIFNVMKF